MHINRILSVSNAVATNWKTCHRIAGAVCGEVVNFVFLAVDVSYKSSFQHGVYDLQSYSTFLMFYTRSHLDPVVSR